MANFHVQGIDDLAKGLKLLGQETGPMAEDMLRAGAVIMIGTWNRVIIQVYPQGKDKDGTRNAEKAFLLHYGWKSNAATKGPWVGDHFVNEIEDQGTPKAIEAMEFIMNKQIERSGL